MKVVNQVIETNDYALFSAVVGNRAINALHVKRLKDSFREEYLLSPIIVNQDYQVIDGQHRFEAAKELGLPIRFVLCNDYGLKEVQMLNANTHNWNKQDYLKAYCDLGYPEYLKFRDFMKRFPDLGLANCEVICTNRLSNVVHSNDMKGKINATGSYTQNSFQNGKFEIYDYEKAVDNAEKIMMVKPFYDGFARKTFVTTMVGLFKLDHYSHSRFLDRLSAQPGALQHCTSIIHYKMLIEDIYNYRSREKVNLRF